MIEFIDTPLFSRLLLTIYAKNEAENIPAHVLRTIKETLDRD